MQNLKPLSLLSPSSRWHVKRFSSKHIALKEDVTGLENILFARMSLHLSAWKFYTQAVKGLTAKHRKNCHDRKTNYLFKKEEEGEEQEAEERR